MISLLEDHVDKMGDYGLVYDQINDVKLNFDEYQISLHKPRFYEAEINMVTRNMDELMLEAKEYAEKLDKVMKRFKRSNITFYNGYLAARTVID